MNRRAIFWDLGNVLVTFDDRQEVAARIVSAFGGDASAVKSLFPSASGEAAYERLDMGQVSHEEFWRTVCRTAGIQPSRLTLPLFSALYVEHLKPVEPMMNLLCELDHRHVPAYAISNGDFGSTYLVHMLEARYGVRFLEMFLSWEYQMKKPLLIEKAAGILKSRYAIAPAECVLVDDQPQYVEAAARLGMEGILFDARKDSVTDLIGRLNKAGIFISSPIFRNWLPKGA